MSLMNKLMAPVNTAVISILGLGQFLIGFWLLLPFNSWGGYVPTPIPEWAIGLLLMFIGSWVTKASLSADLPQLQWATNIAYLFWIVTMVIMLIVHAAGTGWIFALILAVYCFMINLNIRVNRRNIK
jgi:hypothetical protein